MVASKTRWFFLNAARAFVMAALNFPKGKKEAKFGCPEILIVQRMVKSIYKCKEGAKTW
jgi:hypothetical protein